MNMCLNCTSSKIIANNPTEGCVFNHPVVMSCLIWAIVVLILGILIAYLVYHYLKKKNKFKQAMAEATRKHELKLKEFAFEQEQFWYFQKELKKDYLKELNDSIQKLEKEKKKLSEDLDNEKKNRNETLEKERIQAEHDFYEKVLATFYNTGNTQQPKN